MTATHNVKAYRNSMSATSGKAPFLGRYIPNETLPFEALCTQVAALSGQTAIQVRAILEGSFDAIAELEKDGLAIVHLDGMIVFAVIKGSFPTSDAAFDPEHNALNLAIRLDDSVRLALANVTPRMVADEDLPKVRVDNLKDVEVERPTNLIHGRHPFRVAGHKLILSDEGARVYIKGKSAVEHEVVVDNVHSDQLFTAHTAELLEGGDYTLWVESRAGVEDGPLQRDNCRVKYLRVEDPAPHITGGHSESHADDGKCYADGSGFVLEGDNLEGAIVTIAGSANEGETWSYEETVPADKVNFDADMLTVDGNWLDTWYNHMDVGELVKFTVETTQGEDSIQRTLSA